MGADGTTAQSDPAPLCSSLAELSIAVVTVVRTSTTRASSWGLRPWSDSAISLASG